MKLLPLLGDQNGKTSVVPRGNGKRGEGTRGKVGGKGFLSIFIGGRGELCRMNKGNWDAVKTSGGEGLGTPFE